MISRQAPKCQQNPFGPNMMAFSSPEDMMKNLPKAMANISKAIGGGGMPTDSPTFKISMREYQDMAIKVGDKITVEIKESDSRQREIRSYHINRQDVEWILPFLVIFGGLVLAILFISYYLIPNVICEALRKNISQGTPQNAP